MTVPENGGDGLFSRLRTQKRHSLSVFLSHSCFRMSKARLNSRKVFRLHKSDCRKSVTIDEKLFKKFQNSILLVSYRYNGVPTINELVDMLKKYKMSIEIKKLDYKYVLSNGRSKEILIIAQ